MPDTHSGLDSELIFSFYSFFLSVSIVHKLISFGIDSRCFVDDLLAMEY